MKNNKIVAVISCVEPAVYLSSTLSELTGNALTLTESQAIDIIAAYVDDYINSKAAYAVPQPSAVDKVLNATFPWWEEATEYAFAPNYDYSRIPKFSSNFKANVERLCNMRNIVECNALLPAYAMIRKFIQTLIPTTTWTVWFTKRNGEDILLEEGEDFRIIDWTRRKEAGEF